MIVSEEVRRLDGKEGSLTELAKQYLDAKKINYSVLQAKPRDTAVRLKGIDPAVEPGSIMIEKKGKSFIIEELTKVCGASGRYHDVDKNVKASAILDRVPRVLFKTYKDQKNLYIHTDARVRERLLGTYIGGGEITVDMEDILKQPSKIPDDTETFEINCDCDMGKLKCKGHAWQW